ncbi:ABC transporter substrate-binding protein [Thermasporomyces composti]|jgi:osmoprotectant transport system substrate-binding protein|uniref:Osmoprotectant transport system substrate-binding protein n=1 Tax=Thermasporomyces composti TaxID=696763 RepID=A0A3D9V497_THECX|nr:ABC transporter substrate-binding protein [Thermasporomyces composti]REF36652.1 osmoprotectant transport system substrate-binding protein [Thermasporomyces composti]
MRPTRTLLATVVAGLLAITACGGGGDPLATNSTEPAGRDTITVGSANFPEAVLLGEIYAGALEAKGIQVERKLNIGSRETYIKGLEDGSLDLVPEYTGVLLQYYDSDATAAEPDEVYAALRDALPSGLTVLEMSSAEDKDAVVVTRETAEEYDLSSIEDLKPYASSMVLGGPPEWKTRPTGVPGLEKVYGLTFKSFKELDTAGPVTVAALKSGQVDAANLFTTQSAIEENDFVVLEDPKLLFTAQNVVPLIVEDKASDTVRDALNAVSAQLDTETLRELVRKVEVDKEDPDTVAEEWLTTTGLV